MFVLASMDLFLMSDYWGVTIKFETTLILTLGVLSFFLAAIVADKIKLKKIKSREVTVDIEEISNTRFIIYVCVYLFTLSAIVLYRVRTAGLGFVVGSIMSSYSSSIDLDELITLPIALKLISLLCVSMTYVYAYLFSVYWSRWKKVSKKLLVMLIVCAFFLLITQKRGTFIMFAINLFCQMLLQSKVLKAKRLSGKLYLYIAIGTVALMLSFNSIASLMGRSFGEDNAIALFSVYLGGPILNLNAVVDKMPTGSNMPLSETFLGLYQAIYKNTGVEAFNLETTRIFRSSMSHATGNVYTTFYDFYYDGGIVGVIVLTAIMSYVACRIYKKIKIGNPQNKVFESVLYAYVFTLVWRSFFANAFYDWIQLSTLETLVVWFAASYTLRGRLKWKSGKITIKK